MWLFSAVAIYEHCYAFGGVLCRHWHRPSFSSLQEAQKRMKIKSPPRILALHLKRFKYIEQLGRYKKLSYRVVFPLELKLCNTTDDAPGSEAEYSLFAVVVHVGSGPNHGHYVSLVKSHSHWLFFDDENVEIIDESVVQTFFGSYTRILQQYRPWLHLVLWKLGAEALTPGIVIQGPTFRNLSFLICPEWHRLDTTLLQEDAVMVAVTERVELVLRRTCGTNCARRGFPFRVADDKRQVGKCSVSESHILQWSK